MNKNVNIYQHICGIVSSIFYQDSTLFLRGYDETSVRERLDTLIIFTLSWFNKTHGSN